MSELVKLDRVQRELGQVQTPAQAKALYDKIETLSQYAKRYGLDTEKQNEIARAKLDTARKGGGLLWSLDGTTSGRKKVLPDGIDKRQSARWQRLAAIPEREYQDEVERLAVEGDDVITVADLLRFWRRLNPPKDVPPLPEGKFRCVVIDPPWPVEKIERDERPRQTGHLDYPVMSIEDIGALPVGDKAAEDGCHVYLWVTHKFLPAGLDLFSEWGVKYECSLTWVKPVGITPFSWMYNTEHCLFGRVGALLVARKGLKLGFTAPTGRHSEKPDEFYERVLEASPERRLEMFARTEREGFVPWGNEVPLAA